MANEAIGHLKCPWCGSARARVSVDKRGKANVTCSACHSQTFAHGQLSDMAIRQAMTPISKAPAMPVPAPGEEIALPGALEASGGVPTAPPEPKPAAAQPEKPVPVAPPEKKRGAWDIY